MPISQSEYARRRGVSRQYVSRLVKEGVIRLKNGKVDPAQADAALAARRDPARPLRRKTAGPKAQGAPRTSTQDAAVSVDTAVLPGSAGGDLPKMLLKTRIKSELEKGKLLEIKARVEAGKYVDADEVKVAAPPISLASEPVIIPSYSRMSFSIFHAQYEHMPAS